jgi:hypothetical protein
MSAGSVLRSLLVAVLAVGLTACGSDPGSGGGPTSFERADAAKFLLGPRDLGRGYAITDDRGCGPFAPEEYPEEFTKIILASNAAGCSNEIAYIWGGARPTVVPRLVQNGVAIFGSESDARQGMRMRSELVRFMVSSSPEGFEPLQDFGHEAVRFRDGGYDVPHGAGVLWRNGNMLSILFAGGEGMTREQADAAAVDLARKQQDRIEHPRPAEPSKMDPELPLDDPSIDVPVYWLGRTFAPGGGLPALEFGRSYRGTGLPDDPLGFSVETDYGAREAPGVVKIWVFSPGAFEKFEDGVLARRVTDAPCASKSRLEVSGGHAVIWGGYAKPTRAPCPSRSFDRWVAYVHLKGAVVTVGQPWGLYPCCTPYPSDPYNTPEGLAAIASGLQIRKPR